MDTTLEINENENNNSSGISGFLSLSFSQLKKWARNISWNEKGGIKYFLISLISLGILIISNVIGGIIGVIISLLATLLVFIGSIGFFLNISKGSQVSLYYFWKSITWERIRKFIVIGLLQFVVSLIFSLLFNLLSGFFLVLFFKSVVLGIILIILIVMLILILFFRISFCTYAIVDNGMGPIRAIGYSRKITKRYGLKIFLLLLYGCIPFFAPGILLAISFILHLKFLLILSVILFIILFIWVVPMIIAMITGYYLKLVANYENVKRIK